MTTSVWLPQPFSNPNGAGRGTSTSPLGRWEVCQRKVMPPDCRPITGAKASTTPGAFGGGGGGAGGLFQERGRGEGSRKSDNMINTVSRPQSLTPQILFRRKEGFPSSMPLSKPTAQFLRGAGGSKLPHDIRCIGTSHAAHNNPSNPGACTQTHTASSPAKASLSDTLSSAYTVPAPAAERRRARKRSAMYATQTTGVGVQTCTGPRHHPPRPPLQIPFCGAQELIIRKMLVLVVGGLQARGMVGRAEGRCAINAR